MKIARFRVARRVAFGVVEGDEIIEIRGSIYSRFRLTDTQHPLSAVKILPPTDPREIWGPGVNFADHLETAALALGKDVVPIPEHPQPWQKARNSLTGTGDPIIIPKDSTGEVHYEGEVVAVIGKNCRRVTSAQAKRYILGFTCGNDVSERTWQKGDFSFWRAKGADTFAPVGPWIETECDPQQLEIVVRLNTEEVQRFRTNDMLFSFDDIVSYISQSVTLRPGDLVFSGCAGVTGAIKPGDTVEVEVEEIGLLRNPVETEFEPSTL